MIRTALDGPVARVTLDRPERHNSLVPELLEQLADAFAAVDADAGLRVAVLAARGRSFSTGGDLGAFPVEADRARDYARELVGRLNAAIERIAACRVPVIAAVDGQVSGGALGLVLACDLVVVSDRASFRPWYTTVGFSPDGGWTAMLPALIGRQRAALVQFLDAGVTPGQAVAWGLAAERVTAGQLYSRVDALAGRIAAQEPGAVEATKRLLRHDGWRAGLAAELAAFVDTVGRPAARAGIERYLASRGEVDD